MADLNKAQSISLKITQAACSPDHDHPNILTIYAAVDLTHPATTISPSEEQGHIKAQLIAVGKMRLTSPQGQAFYHECQAYDTAHSADCARLDKVENFLANESFVGDFGEIVAGAEIVLFIEEAWLHRSLRGKGLSLVMVKEFIKLLTLVVMLQAGGITREADNGDESTERLTRHWKKLGFSEWSDSDDAWLLRSTPLSE
ncbi:hypothetical protein LTR22_009151 [Elasticomyces elasticus]|nr:hypothetical protein LTR22_009151 [Elasticomyces elasticus]KAK4917611.1 hypothetical protein LTR49_014565 [Elasticomyces elasticus]